MLFTEPSYQLQEADLYVRLLDACQPATIMEWQITSDYLLVTGGGTDGDASPIKPTMRFWTYKQLSETPAGMFHLPVSVDRQDVTGAAFGDLAQGRYMVHPVNTGAARDVVLSGFPAGITSLRIRVTSMHQGMEEAPAVAVVNGEATAKLAPDSLTTFETAP